MSVYMVAMQVVGVILGLSGCATKALPSDMCRFTKCPDELEKHDVTANSVICIRHSTQTFTETITCSIDSHVITNPEHRGQTLLDILCQTVFCNVEKHQKTDNGPTLSLSRKRRRRGVSVFAFGHPSMPTGSRKKRKKGNPSG